MFMYENKSNSLCSHLTDKADSDNSNNNNSD